MVTAGSVIRSTHALKNELGLARLHARAPACWRHAPHSRPRSLLRSKGVESDGPSQSLPGATTDDLGLGALCYTRVALDACAGPAGDCLPPFTNPVSASHIFGPQTGTPLLGTAARHWTQRRSHGSRGRTRSRSLQSRIGPPQMTRPRRHLLWSSE